MDTFPIFSSMVLVYFFIPISIIQDIAFGGSLVLIFLIFLDDELSKQNKTIKSKTKPISTLISSTDADATTILLNILSDKKFTETSTQITTVETEENIFENNTPDNSIETNLNSASLNISHHHLPDNDLTNDVTLCQLQNDTEVSKNNISTQISHSTELVQSHTPDSSYTSNTLPIKHNLDSNSSNKTSSHDIPKHLWNKRHLLFEKFDDGILLDYESFYSVCPEILSKHIAKRCEGYNVAMDPFCGAGGNVIQLAMKYKKVIAIDIDPNKLEFAKKNAEIYGVRDKIEFIEGDFFTLAKDLKKYKAEVIVTSPPWGGPSYKNHKTYSLEKNMCSEYYGGGRTIFELARSIAPNVALHIPKSTDRNELFKLGKYFNNNIEIQSNFINGKLDSITTFFGRFKYMNSKCKQTNMKLFNQKRKHN